MAADLPDVPPASTRVVLTLQRMRWPLVIAVFAACLIVPVPGPAKATVMTATLVLVFWIPFLHRIGTSFGDGWREGGSRDAGRRR